MDTQIQASYLVLGVASLAQVSIRGRLASLFEARVTGSRPCLSPVWILGSGRPLKTIRLPRTSRFDLDVPVHWARRGIGFQGLQDSPSSRHFAPRRRSLRSLALDPRTPGSAPRARGLRPPLSLSRIAKTIKISIVRTMGP